MRKIFMVMLLTLLVGSFLTTTALAQQQGQMQNAERMSQIIGQTAKDQQGQDLGKIEDVITDMQGRTLYLVLSGDKMGKKDEMIPVPWQAANPRIEKGAVMLNLSQQKLKNAPTFKQNQWSQFDQLQPKTNSYFGAAAMPSQQRNQQKMTPGQKGVK
jgi:hypothetical protein